MSSISSSQASTSTSFTAQPLYNCLVHIISFPLAWDDHLTYSKEILKSHFEILKKYFPHNTPTMEYIPSLGKETSQGVIFLTSTSDTVHTVKIWKKIYVIHPHDELALPIPEKEKYLHIFYQSTNKPYQYPLTQLLSQRPVALPNKTIPLQVHYLFQPATQIQAKSLFPSIQAEAYSELLKQLDLVQTAPSDDLQWIVDEFARQFEIDSITRTQTYLRLALEKSTFFNRHIISQLVLLIKNIDRKHIFEECNELLERFKMILKRFDYVYSTDNVESFEGCISGIILLIETLSPDSQEILRECIINHMELKYKLFINNYEQDEKSSTSMDIAVLAKAAKLILKDLINFKRNYVQEFKFDMLKILATGYYEKLKIDIKEIFKEDLILTETLVSLHNHLSKLHYILCTWNIIDDSRVLLNVEDLFSPYILKYLNEERAELLAKIPVYLQKDTFKPIQEDCHHSNSIWHIFYSIENYSSYIFKYKYVQTRKKPKIHLLAIIEDVIDLYIRSATKMGCTLIDTPTVPQASSSTSPLQECSEFSMERTNQVMTIIYNILHIRSKFNEHMHKFEIDYELKNLDIMIENSIVELFPKLVDYLLKHHLDDLGSLHTYLDYLINKVAAANLPIKFFKHIIDILFEEIIHWVEDESMKQTLSNEMLKSIIKCTLPGWFDLFQGLVQDVEHGISKEVMTSHCRLLEEVGQYFDFPLKFEEKQNISVFAMKIIAPQVYSEAIKYICSKYPKYAIIQTWIPCEYKKHLKLRKGFLFQIQNTLMFISRSSRKIISLGEIEIPPVQNDRLQIKNYLFKKINLT